MTEMFPRMRRATRLTVRDLIVAWRVNSQTGRFPGFAVLWGNLKVTTGHIRWSSMAVTRVLRVLSKWWALTATFDYRDVSVLGFTALRRACYCSLVSHEMSPELLLSIVFDWAQCVFCSRSGWRLRITVLACDSQSMGECQQSWVESGQYP